MFECEETHFSDFRLDNEEMLVEEKKTFDVMKKDAESMVRKTRVIDQSLAAAEKDLEDFQVGSIPAILTTLCICVK